MTYWRKVLNRHAARNNLIRTLDAITQAMKKRDMREPGRRKKLATEQEIIDILRRVWRKQERAVREYLSKEYPDRKAIYTYTPPIIGEWDDDEFARMWTVITNAIRGGIDLFAIGLPIMDYSLTNAEAAAFARDYTFELVREINTTTQSILQRTISGFAETPGMTLRDVMNSLPFDEGRAMRVAVTETTRAYAEGNQLAGDALKKEFPGMRIIKTWFTNNDDRVCDICGPLDGMTIGIDEEFPDAGQGPPAHVNCRCWTQTGTDING